MSPRFPDLVSAATFQDFRGVRLLGKGRREGKVGMGPSGINFLAASKRGCHTRAHECRDDQPARSRPFRRAGRRLRSAEHTSELQSLMRTSYAVFCLKKKTRTDTIITKHITSEISNQTRDLLST